MGKAEQKQLADSTDRPIVNLCVPVAVVGAETGPAELVLAAVAIHVFAPSVLLDEFSAHRTRLTSENFPQVTEGLSAARKEIRDLDLELFEFREVHWVSPFVLADAADKVLLAFHVQVDEASVVATLFRTLAHIITCDHVLL